VPNITDHRRLSRLLLGVALAAAWLPLAPAAFAGTVERAEPIAVSAAVPGSEPGAFRTWVQLVWNPATRALERLQFTAWDPVPSLGLEPSWLPDDPAGLRSGLVAGRGTLSFRTPGAAAYDPAGTVAQYRGNLVAGRPDGVGEFLDRTGFSYAGEWRAGLMEGQGRLTLADGDEYVGAFHAGLREGEGTLTDATGRIWSGHFTAGVPDAAPLPAQADGGLRLGIVTERRPHNYELGMDPLSYVTRSEGETLTILPDDQRLLELWHGDVSITMNDAELSAFNSGQATPSFLGERERFDPVSLVFSLENSTTATISILGGYLDVAASARNKEPAIQIRPFPDDRCAAPDPLPRFFIDDFGWASADNAALSFTLGAPDGRSEGTPLTVPLGQISGSVTADLAPPLATLGVDTADLAGHPLLCSDPADERLCLAELRQSGRFGRLDDFLSLKGTTVAVTATGTLAYDWTAADGSVRHKQSPFAVRVPLAALETGAECGEGGEIMPIRHDPFELQLDQQGYRVALPFAADVTPGFTARWRIELLAPETSDHDFTVVLLLSDGSMVTSRPIRLTYFMPPRLETLARP
jgi:hypothetical protein